MDRSLSQIPSFKKKYVLRIDYVIFFNKKGLKTKDFTESKNEK